MSSSLWLFHHHFWSLIKLTLTLCPLFHYSIINSKDRVSTIYKPSVWSRSTAYCHCTFQLIFLQMQKKYKYAFSSILILENETNAIYCFIFSPLCLWRMGLAGPPSMKTIKQHWTRAGNRGQHFWQFCALPVLSSSGLAIKSLRGDILVWDVDRLGSLSTLPCVTAEQTDNTVRNKSSASTRGPGQFGICNQSSCCPGTWQLKRGGKIISNQGLLFVYEWNSEIT